MCDLSLSSGVPGNRGTLNILEDNDGEGIHSLDFVYVREAVL